MQSCFFYSPNVSEKESPTVISVSLKGRISVLDPVAKTESTVIYFGEDVTTANVLRTQDNYFVYCAFSAGGLGIANVSLIPNYIHTHAPTWILCFFLLLSLIIYIILFYSSFLFLSFPFFLLSLFVSFNFTSFFLFFISFHF